MPKTASKISAMMASRAVTGKTSPSTAAIGRPEKSWPRSKVKMLLR